MLKTLNIILLLSIISFVSCKTESILEGQIGLLKFSEEKIEFDTIFTKTRSITRQIKVYNPTSNEINIPKLYVVNGSESEFALNVNGIAGNSHNNLSILPNDSIFIFVQANLQENFKDTSIIHLDSICFEYTNTREYIPLIAWGQDIIKHEGARINSTTFTAGKPHVIIDSLIVNEGETLTIEAGAKLYLNFNSNLIVEGTLIIEGTIDNNVTIASTRLEEAYLQHAGLWGSIIFRNGSKNNSIIYTEIKNGLNAIVINKAESPIDLEIHNTKIHDFSVAGIQATNAKINCSNSVFYKTYSSSISLQGGEHIFNHITLFNDGTFEGRKHKASVYISDINSIDSSATPINSIQFSNSILIGKLTNEITINADDNSNIKISNCLIKDKLTTQEKPFFIDETMYDKTKNLFKNYFNSDFSLDTLSQVKNIGKLEFGQITPTDIQGNSRTEDNKPDIGAYEYFYTED